MKIILASLFVLFGSCLPCAATELTGTVRSKSGKPLAETWVFSSEYGRAVTGADGRYKMDVGNLVPGDRRVLCFWNEGFRPLIKVVDRSTPETDVILEEFNGTERVIPTCGKANKSEKRLGTFLRVLVPKGAAIKKSRGFEAQDFHIFVGSGKKRLWVLGISGIHTTKGFPEDKWILTSREYTMQPWRDESGNLGVDVRGRSEDGTYWRYLGFWSEAVMYSEVTKDEAAVLDQIIDSVCFLSYP